MSKWYGSLKPNVVSTVVEPNKLRKASSATQSERHYYNAPAAKKVRSKNLLPSLKKSFPAKPLSNVNYGVTTTPTTAASSGKHSKQVTATDSGHSQSYDSHYEYKHDTSSTNNYYYSNSDVYTYHKDNGYEYYENKTQSYYTGKKNQAPVGKFGSHAQKRRGRDNSYATSSQHHQDLNALQVNRGYSSSYHSPHYQYYRLVAVRPPKTVHHIRAAFSGVGKLKILCVKPLLIQIDNFFSPSRCKRVVNYANSKLKFTKESADVEHGDRRARTSTGCWMSEDSQINHPDIKYINESLANLVGFPEENCEPLHVVKYKGGQEYWPHNDFIENHKHMSCGGRIATMLVYLTDCADGGATNFPLLDVTIYPKPGTVVLWYNVLPTSDGRHVIVDQRMLHAGMPVGPAGEKMIMCKWVHPFSWISE